MTETQIMTFFSVYGQVATVEIERCPTTGGSLGIAHVSFSSNEFTDEGHLSACLAVEKGNGRKMGSADCVKVSFDPKGDKLKLAIEEANRPTTSIQPLMDNTLKRPPLNTPGTPSSHRRHENYPPYRHPHYAESEGLYDRNNTSGRNWDNRYDSRNYSRSSRDEYRYRNYHDDEYNQNSSSSSRYRDERLPPSSRSSYHGSGPPPYSSSSSSRYASPRDSERPRWTNRSPSMSSPDSRYRSRSRSRSRSGNRDNYYIERSSSSRWENESDWGRYNNNNSSNSSRRRPDYWEDRKHEKSSNRPTLVISRKTLPFIRGVLEDLKKMFYYYNFIDVNR